MKIHSPVLKLLHTYRHTYKVILTGAPQVCDYLEVVLVTRLAQI